jgi:hypothetical protein
MPSTSTEIAIPKTIEEICEYRTNILAHYEEAVKSVERGKALVAEIGGYWPNHGRRDSSNIGMEHNRKEFGKQLDRNLWRLAFEKTNLMQVLDAEARKEFEKALDEDTPEFTVANIRSTFYSVAVDAEMMMNRGIVNVFKWLSPKYKTNSNEPFKLDRKCVATWMFRYCVYSRYLQVNYGRAQDTFNDIDRVLKTLDGKKHIPRELHCAIDAAMKECAAKDLPYIYENDYLKVKGFKNGNCHMEFKRADLLEKINDAIAQHYGDNVLAKGRAA